MFHATFAQSSQSLVASLTTMIFILVAVVAWLVMARRIPRPYVSASSFSHQPFLIPIARGLVTIQVPTGMRAAHTSTGGLVLAPNFDIGVQMVICASMLPHDLDAEDPVRSEIDAWAATRDGTVTVRNGTIIAEATEQVEHGGREFELRHWLVGRDLTIISIVAEIDKRASAKRPIQQFINKIPKIIDQLRINAQRHTIGHEAQHADYVAYESNALIVRNIDKHDQAFIEKWESKAQEILQSYLAPRRLERITPEILDWCLTLCQRDNNQSKPSFDDVSKAFGVAFGNCCVRGLELRWGAVDVDGARHLVLRHIPSRLVLFPLRALESTGSLSHRFEPLYGIATALMQMRQQQRAA